jgi:hypothetical protein
LHHANHSTIDDALRAIPDGIAPNIRAVGPSLRRAANTLQPTAGIHLILDGLRTHT